ncbi:MAG: hypothetical protein PHV34_16015 [Verrucomicrobiae bacterium]|nr:hypothetical protein [Verrucomicrobiae bacterium]
MISRRILFACGMIASVCHAGNLLAASNPVPLDDLRSDEIQRSALSRTAQQLLAQPSIEWNHAQSEHFVYHFTQKWMAERAAAEAETYYGWTKKDLKIEEDRWEIRAHIFLVESKPLWQQFISQVGVDQWSGGFYARNEIFLLSPPQSSPFIGSVLPHELTHMVLHRFLRGVLPTWLNEGVCEQQSRKHYYTYTTPKGFKFIPPPTLVELKHYIPLSVLTSASDYPSDNSRIHDYYIESARLVQFLLEEHPSADFMGFLQAMADGLKFDNALERVYGGWYRDMEIFETKFKKAATIAPRP